MFSEAHPEYPVNESDAGDKMKTEVLAPGDTTLVVMMDIAQAHMLKLVMIVCVLGFVLWLLKGRESTRDPLGDKGFT